jgi:hypothetical protein
MSLSTSRQSELIRMVEQLRLFADEAVADGHARAHSLRALADDIERREFNRAEDERQTSLEVVSVASPPFPGTVTYHRAPATKPPSSENGDFHPGGVCGGF